MWGSGSQLEPEIEAHWATGQPDNKKGGDPAVDDVDCVNLSVKSNSASLLWDNLCSEKRHSVCEKLAGESLLSKIFTRSPREVGLIADGDSLSSE